MMRRSSSTRAFTSRNEQTPGRESWTQSHPQYPYWDWNERVLRECYRAHLALVGLIRPLDRRASPRAPLSRKLRDFRAETTFDQHLCRSEPLNRSQ
jgi:hypothetical protein